MRRRSKPDSTEAARKLSELQVAAATGRHSQAASLKESFIREHLAEVNAVAASYGRRPGLERADLQAAALGGLARAIDRFDLARGEPFLPFARAWMHGEVRNVLATGPLVRRRRRERELTIRYHEIALQFAARHGRPPSYSEAAEELGVAEQELERAVEGLSIEVAGPSLELVPTPPTEDASPDIVPEEIGGNLFGKGLLLAVLHRRLRVPCMRWMLAGDWCDSGGAWRAVQRYWRELGWPLWFYTREGTVGLVRAGILADLTNPDPLVQENAAMAVWLVHAYPELRREFLPRSEQSDPELVSAVLRAASIARDPALRWVAIHLCEAVDPLMLARILPASGSVYHVANSPILLERHPPAREGLWDEFRKSSVWLAGNETAVGDDRMFVSWDLSLALCKAPAPTAAEYERLAATAGSTRVAAYAAAAAAIPMGEEPAREAFFRALLEDRTIRHKRHTPGKGELVRWIEHCLTGPDSRSHAVFRQRLAAEMLRFLDPPDRLRIGVQALGTRPFVRLSVISALRDKEEHHAVPELAAHIRGQLGPGDGQALEVAIGTLIGFRPEAGLAVCSLIGRECNTELRGRSLCWEAELMFRHRGQARTQVVEDLCRRTLLRRESAVNMAQLLLVAEGLPGPWRPGEFGLHLPFRPPFWRTDWG
jgi:hypothetical protein